MTIKTREIRRGLVQKNFSVEDKHHEFFYLHIDGQRTHVSTKMSQGESEIGDVLIGKMAKQLHLSRDEFLALIECSLTHAKHVELLRTKKVIAMPAEKPINKTTQYPARE